MTRFLMCFCGISLLLAGCGGGGSAAVAPTPAPAPAPVPAPGIEADEPEASVLATPEADPVAEAPDDLAGAGDALDDDFRFEGYLPPGAAPPPAGNLPPLAEAAPEAAGAARMTLHVSPKGADSNPGTAIRPLRSLQRAARLVRPGARVLVAPGQYSGGVRTSIDGQPHARIAFISTTKWGARIVPPRLSPNKTAWDNRADHVDIVGFEVDGSHHQAGVRWTHGIYSGGSHDVIKHNHVHHIAQKNGCTRAGGAAIGVDSYFRGVQAAVISNLVHDIGPAGCRFVQGIYVSTSAQVKNNVVYRVAEGGIHLWHDAHGVIITNNTVTASNTGIIVGGGNFYFSKGPNDHTAVYSNIVYDNKMGISEQGKTGRSNTYRNNLVFDNAVYDWRLKNGLTHSGTVSAAPRFVAGARGAQPNLRLDRSSPAIGRAIADHAEATDFEGRPRNASAGFDIGAFQH